MVNNDINFEKVKKQIDDWFKEKEQDPHWVAMQKEARETDREIKRIRSNIECDYERYSNLIADALDYYLRECYKLEDLKKWK